MTNEWRGSFREKQPDKRLAVVSESMEQSAPLRQDCHRSSSAAMGVS
ncbi:hypothetical protein [Reticulibacter mediterranei]|nr:hypothetical protein [Reticulibacter mediterranei]